MAELQVAVAIIGVGTAGMTAYRAASKHSDDVWLIDPGPLGTTCARVGCMPSKLLIAAADAAHHCEAAAGFGVHSDKPTIDGVAVMARVRAERDRFVGFVLDDLASWPTDKWLRNRARFVAPGLLALDDGRHVRAERIVLATGSRPAIPGHWQEQLGDRLIFSDDVFAWQDLPRSMAVVGAGVIGLELGQALHRLGVRVRIFDRSGHPGGLTDPELAEHACRLLVQDTPLEVRAEITEVLRQGEQVCVRWRDAQGAAQEEFFDYLLAATGRVPNIESLNLGASGLALDERGLPIADPHTGQIGESAVFIAGDVSARRMILHEAADEGRIAGENAARFPDVRVQPRRSGLAIVFSDPQIALAGRSFAELKASGVAFAVGAVDFSNQGRARVMGRNRGLLHVYGEIGSGRFLGAEMIAPNAEHLAHLLAWAVHAQLPVDAMLEAPFYHPVLEEGVRTALRKLSRALKMGPVPVERSLDCGPGG